MGIIEVRSMNSANLRVVTENGIAYELQQYFTFDVSTYATRRISCYGYKR